MNLILGRQGTGKTTVVYKQIQKALKKGEDHLILVVPEQFTLEGERELINFLGTKGILNVDVLSFSRLGNKILDETGGTVDVPLTKTGKYMMLKKAMLKENKNLNLYKGMVNKPGFINELDDFISNIKRRMIEVEDFETILGGNLESGNNIFQRKVRDFTKILKSYEDLLSKGYLDGEAVNNLIIQSIKDSTTIKNASIWIDGFHTFTEQTFRIIEELNKYAKDVTITLTKEVRESSRDEEVFSISQKTMERLIKIAGKDLKIITCHYKDEKKPDEIRHLERELFAYPFKEYPNNVKALDIYIYKNIYEEVEGLARKIVCLVRDNNYRWKDIHIAVNDMENYSFLLQRIFEEYGIPYFMDLKRKISDKPLSILILYTLRAIKRGYNYEDVFAILKSDLTAVSYKEYEELENYVLKYGIRGNKWKKPFEISDDDYDLDTLNQIREKFINPILKLEDKIKDKYTYINITKSLYEYLEDLQVGERLQLLIEELKREHKNDYASEVSQIYNIIIEIFDEIVEIFGEENVDLEDYIQLLETGMESIDLAIIPSSLDQVVVGDITRSRNSNYQVLFCLGMNEGIIPSTPNTSGLFNENDCTQFKELGLEVDDDIHFKTIQEKFLFYNVVSKTEKRIVFSYPLADVEGMSLRPSIIINSIKEIFPSLEEKKDIASHEETITNDRGTIKYLIDYYRNSLEGNEELDDNLWDDVYKWYINNPVWEKHIKRMKEALLFENEIPVLSSKLVKKLYGGSIRTSVTKLEEFVNCPFKHHISFGLKPKRREVFQITLPDLGEILHDLIYEYSIFLESKGLKWQDLEEDESEKICNEIMDSFKESYRHGILQKNYKYRHLARYINRIFIRAVNTLTYHYKKGKFTTFGNELIFGLNKTLPPVSVSLSENQRLYLEGRIDRVDILEQDEKIYMKIMDFKSGNQELSLDEIYYGLSLQLLVYTWVCLNYGRQKGKDSIAAGMFYFKLDDPLVKSGKKEDEEIEDKIRDRLKLKGLMLKDVDVLRSIDEDLENSTVLNCSLKKNGDFKANVKGLLEKDEIELLIKHMKNTIIDIGKEIFKGDISIKPIKTKKKEACAYCMYKSICLFDPLFTHNKYDYKPSLKDDEVLEILIKGEGKR